MRRLIVSMNVTLNGYMADVNGGLAWHAQFWNDEIARAVTTQLAQADTILLGRRTFEAMAPYWINRQFDPLAARDDAEFADLMLRHEKIVFSRTLTRAGNWLNSRLAGKPISREVQLLKSAVGKDILVYGSGKLVIALARLNAIDEYRLWVHPIVLKAGRPLFKPISERLQLAPCSITKFRNGVVLICYEKPVISNDNRSEMTGLSNIIISRLCTD
ncbi:dihydrofolate reductase family protein [Mucilaginibacter litoreus]|uniref:Dihydrofolate reductase family protein n=1 Tax=Mucilaginibacter litoreus TaxID=1048221 RepID=A0ABW3ARU5_9SPHI